DSITLRRMRSAVLVLVAIGVASSAVVYGDPLDKPAFTATPTELLAAAKQAASKDPVTRLDVAEEVHFDDRSRITDRWRMVFVVNTKVGADAFDTLGYEYRPSYQERPQVRARVIDPQGNVTELDPKLAHEEPTEKNGDRLQGAVPLPKLVVGSVVEEEVVIT